MQSLPAQGGCAGQVAQLGWGNEQTPTLSLSWWEGDGKLAQRASLQQRGGTRGEGCKLAMCKGKSGRTLRLLLVQYLHHVLGAWVTPTLSITAQLPGELRKSSKKKKNISFFFKHFPITGASWFVFFPFHARNLSLCAPACCAIPVYVLGVWGWCLTALPMLPGCLGYSALHKGKYSLLSFLQLMGSRDR